MYDVVEDYIDVAKRTLVEAIAQQMVEDGIIKIYVGTRDTATSPLDFIGVPDSANAYVAVLANIPDKEEQNDDNPGAD